MSGMSIRWRNIKRRRGRVKSLFFRKNKRYFFHTTLRSVACREVSGAGVLRNKPPHKLSECGGFDIRAEL